MTNQSYRKLTLGLIGAWLGLVVLASALRAFENNTGSLPWPLLTAAIGPIVAFLLWFATSSEFRRFTESLSPRALTMAQTWRINGFFFLMLGAFGILPALFAVPAGLGDMAIGATAPWIARLFANREPGGGFLVWQLLGILDLVMAVTLGATTSLLNPQATTTGAMSVLPLSLVPTFLVPLLLMFHLICIAQVTTSWRKKHCAQRKQLHSPALG